MLRTLLAMLLASALAGCWGSEVRIFGTEDWSAPPGIAGTYTSENAAGEADASVVLTVRPDGLLEGASTEIGQSESETFRLGFVPIAGGSDDYYFVVDRTKANVDGEIYFIARLTDDGLETFFPNCKGTPDILGMVRHAEGIGGDICTFSTRQALMRAGLEAERFLEQDHMFDVQPMGRMRRDAPEE